MVGIDWMEEDLRMETIHGEWSSRRILARV